MNNYVHPLTFALLPASPLVQFCCRMKPCLPLLLILVLSLPLDHSITHTHNTCMHTNTPIHIHMSSVSTADFILDVYLMMEQIR